MTDDQLTLIIDLLHQIHDEVQQTNGRVRKLEVAVGVLRWAVFFAGPPALAAVGYIYLMHLMP